jgi:hypothetical protein
LTHCFGLRKRQIVRRPTLKDYIDTSARDRSVPRGQSFRLKQKYWGKIRSASEEPQAKNNVDQEELCIAKALREGKKLSKKMGRKASSKLGQWAERSEKAVLKMRSFSQPNEATLANFEKVLLSL